MNINELPEEILVRILSFLPRSDRLESALTCRRWAQTIARAPQLLRDIWLVLGCNEMKLAETVFAKSHRHYENLRLDKMYSLDFNAAFWTKVGPTLRKLELTRWSDCSTGVFLSILQSCSNLESLKIEIYDPSTSGRFELSELPPAIDLRSIQESMSNLRRLHLVHPSDPDTLERFFILMPNVSSIAFEKIKRLESWKSHFLSLLPSMLGASRRITLLNLNSDISNDEGVQLLRISSASLRTLGFDGNFRVPRVLDALRDCSMLRDLDIRVSQAHESRHLLNILGNFPELEYLSIRSGRSDRETFRQEDLMAIFDLRRLRKLHLNWNLGTGSNACVPDEIVQNLSRMISLESLTVGEELGIVDNTRFRILACMPNLRKLVINRIRWDAECLRIVLSDLGKLKTLEIGTSVSLWGSFLRHQQHSELERSMSTPQDSVSSDRQGEQRFSSLEVLRMEGIPLCDACLGRISSHHNLLKIVELSRCPDITNTGLVTLFQREPLLEKLAVDSENLNGTLLEGLGELCRRLRSLKVHSYCKISPRAQIRFKMRRPRVKCEFS